MKVVIENTPPKAARERPKCGYCYQFGDKKTEFRVKVTKEKNDQNSVIYEQ